MTLLRSVACVGVGHWGKNIARNFESLGALHSICDSDPERRTALAEQYPGVTVESDIESLLRYEDLRAVAVATPAETHAELVRKALLAGKDVFVEKPICLELDEARELIELADKRNLVLMVGHILWYHPAILKLKQLIDSGELGNLRYIYSNRLNLGKIRREENILWSFAPHDVSVILGLVGEMPQEVHAVGGDYVTAGVVDVTVSILSFPSGAKAHIFVSWLHPFKEQKLVVVGDKRMAVFNGKGINEEGLTLYSHSIDWEHGEPVARGAEGVSVEYSSEEPLRAECAHFLECVETRAQPRTDGDEALRVLGVLQDCQQALESVGVKRVGAARANNG